MKTHMATLACAIVSMIVVAAESRCDQLLMTTQLHDGRALVASRATAVEHRVINPARTANLLSALKDHELFTFSDNVLPVVVSEYIVDTINIRLVDDSDRQTMIWSMTHEIPRFVADMPSICERLMLFDVMCDDGTMWVLYSVQCAVHFDRVAPDDNGLFRVEQRIPILQQRHSGLWPYLIETGHIFRHDDMTHIGFRLYGAYHHHERSHHYQFFIVEDESVSEIEAAQKIEELRSSVSHELDDKDRPRMTDQLKRPELVENGKSP